MYIYIYIWCVYMYVYILCVYISLSLYIYIYIHIHTYTYTQTRVGVAGLRGQGWAEGSKDFAEPHGLFSLVWLLWLLILLLLSLFVSLLLLSLLSILSLCWYYCYHYHYGCYYLVSWMLYIFFRTLGDSSSQRAFRSESEQWLWSSRPSICFCLGEWQFWELTFFATELLRASECW